MTLSGSTKVHDLLSAHPFLEDVLVGISPKFEMLRNRMARATIGRVATLRTAAGIASVDLDALLQSLAAEVEKRTGHRPEVMPSGAESPRRAQRVEALKGIIQSLHDGGSLEAARARFSEVVEDVEATEIASMEEELIRGGLPVTEVQRLCDVHVGAFRQALDTHAPVQVPAGHPVDTYLAANKTIAQLVTEVAAGVRGVESSAPACWETVLTPLEKLRGIDNHYQRKENQLFPLLERHGVTGPSKVMWGVHDQIRAGLKRTRQAALARDAAAFVSAAPAFTRDVVEMIYKEEKILFPMALQLLSDDEWAEVRRGEDVLGYVLTPPRSPWPAAAAPDVTADPAGTGLLSLMTGAMSLDQVNLLFTHLPFDLSYVDENDTVRFYSEGPERIFPRSPAVIGRQVQNCHPPKSVHVVEEILRSFRSGKQSVAEFWIPVQGKFLHIRYVAIRDKERAYRGCLEITQDVTGIRKLEGERRLLQWEPETPRGDLPA
jgi:hypothetical protein